ncbi:hypothetical protein DL96DRAFT_1538486 [Flagelloscypha sp. PMI_526]|nr:hypothetical protein DL96DRAFT_1538486 [Flagelloscypha sp. PMI_526]
MFWSSGFPNSPLADVATPVSAKNHAPSSPATFDYIIVGGGTAGCVLARRLAERKDGTVLLVERGRPRNGWLDKNPLLSRNPFMPGAPVTFLKPEPATSAAGQVVALYQAKGLGGATLINGGMWTRPVAAEFETWKNEFGIKDWTWEKALPLLSKCETVLSDVHADASFRGHDGPIHMRVGQDLPFKPIEYALTAAQNLNIPLAPRPNDPNSPPSNITRVDFIYDASAHRTTTASSYLPASFVQEHSKYITVVTETIATSLDVQTGDDGRIFVAGVFLEAEKPGTQSYYVAATKEVFCSGGAVSTPQVLQLSGIGPRHLLESHNIPAKVDLPVGETLEDHSMVSVNWTCPKKDTVNAFMSNPLLLIGELFKYLVWGTGLFMMPGAQPIVWIVSSMIDEKTGMLKEQNGDSADGSKAENIPDIEFLIIPVGTPTPEGKFDAIPNNDGGFAITTSLLRPVSSGRVHITTSSDPRQNPLVDLGSLTSPEDFVVLRKGVRLALRIGEEIKRLGYPLKDWKRPESLSDDDVDAFIKKNVQSGYHLTSSCPMTKVVDEKLKVKGVDNLRVADASVFPRCVATHPMAATVMLAERRVDELL